MLPFTSEKTIPSPGIVRTPTLAPLPVESILTDALFSAAEPRQLVAWRTRKPEVAAKLAPLKTKYAVLKARYDTLVPSEQVDAEIRQAAALGLVTDATSTSDKLAPSIVTEQNAEGTEE